ncbi:MAG: hypothetical protein LC130_12605 [Bryobacterales bacterium]|nr:hypothetical protein [Bryobacterales bacterium]
MTEFLEGLAKEPKLVGSDPAAFWKSAGILNIQQGGNSQTEMLERFEAVLKTRRVFPLRTVRRCPGNFIYLDDAIFTGNRVRRDLEPWIQDLAPQKATVHVIVNAIHAGSYYAAQQLDFPPRRPERRSPSRGGGRCQLMRTGSTTGTSQRCYGPPSFPKTEKIQSPRT